MIRIQIIEIPDGSGSGPDSIERYTRTVDTLDIEAAAAAISAVITKQAPARKRRSDAGKRRTTPAV